METTLNIELIERVVLENTGLRIALKAFVDFADYSQAWPDGVSPGLKERLYILGVQGRIALGEEKS